ncbi:transposase, partial [Lacticaseibacillus paracasei]
TYEQRYGNGHDDRDAKRHKIAVLAAVTSPYSNGPIEGVNRLIKSLKRSCFGFKNQLNFFKRIYQITA